MYHHFLDCPPFNILLELFGNASVLLYIPLTYMYHHFLDCPPFNILLELFGNASILLYIPLTYMYHHFLDEFVFVKKKKKYMKTLIRIHSRFTLLIPVCVMICITWCEQS